MVRINALTRGLVQATVLAKLETFTPGNSGMGLAIAAVVKGYKCVFTTTDKQSKEKIDALRAFGAEVIVCPTNVDPQDPRSYYSVSSRLAAGIPGAWEADPYDKPSQTAPP